MNNALPAIIFALVIGIVLFRRVLRKKHALRNKASLEDNMKILTFILIAFSVLNFASALTGISYLSAHLSTTGTTNVSVGHYGSLYSRGIAAAYGSLFLLMAYGIQRRVQAALIAGFFILVASWVNLFFYVAHSITADPQPYGPHGRSLSVALIMSVSSLVFFYWGCRWYKSRNHFTK